MRLGGTDGHRREQADAEEKGDTEDGAGEGRGGERHGAHAADHDAVGESDEDLADVACRDRQGQAEGRAQFAQGFTKRGHGGRKQSEEQIAVSTAQSVNACGVPQRRP
jgi:hypothetical protein